MAVLTLVAGQSCNLTIELFDFSGNPLPISPGSVSASIDNHAVLSGTLTSANTGRVTGISPGVATVTISAPKARDGTLVVTVLPPNYLDLVPGIPFP